tara:strand:- start:35 stop:589 length:555 start_codon:yes stop_codon:yes gene_type:complete
MKYKKLNLPEVVLFEPTIFKDARGFNLEAFNLKDFKEATSLNVKFVQSNLSKSSRNVIRGLHYQSYPKSQGKLVQAIEGEIFDVAVDLRKSSKSFGKWVGAKLSEKNKNLLWIPEGFGHGYIVMSKYATIHYQLTNFYDPKKEKSILWNDSEIGIKWPLKKNINPIVSKKDKIGKSLKNAKVYK